MNRRVRAHLSDLTMIGLIETNKRNEGRNAGRYNEYELKVPLDKTLEILGNDPRFSEIVETFQEQALDN